MLVAPLFRLALLLLALLATQAHALPQVPQRLPGLGTPLSDHAVRARLQQYCAPIQRWHQIAFELCLESGFNVNRAVRDYHQRGCSSAGGADCNKLQQLYANNFRLWDGSVDNVGRAKGMGGGNAASGTAVTSQSKGATAERCSAASKAAGQALARLELWQQQWQTGAAADALESAAVAALQLQLEQLALARQQLPELWPTMPAACSRGLSRQAEQFQQRRRQLDEVLAEHMIVGQQRLQALQQQAACDAALLLHSAYMERLRQQWQQERQLWRQRWLGTHPAPLRLGVPSLPQEPPSLAECDSARQQLDKQWQLMVELHQQMANERQLTLMLLAGDAHYPQLQQSRRDGLLLSLLLAALMLLLGWFGWRRWR